MAESGKAKLLPVLLTVCVAALGAGVFALLYLLFHISNATFQWILIALGLLAAAFVLLLALGVLYIALASKSKKPLSAPGRFLLRRALSLYPAATALGGLFGISKNEIQDSYVALNNQMVMSQKYHVAAGDIVVLAPHCLQRNTCSRRVTLDVGNCAECGECDIAALKQMCGRMGVKLVVVTGGTLARNQVKALRPRAVVAIACERDLSSGIMDVYPLPALGVKNLRPEGPCVNTRVLLEPVEQAIRFFTGEGEPCEV